MAAISAGLRFILELVGMGALAYWGYGASEEAGIRLILASVTVLMFVAAWAIVVAPKAANPIPPIPRRLIGTGLLLAAALALGLAGQPTAALLYGSLVILDAAVALVVTVR